MLYIAENLKALRKSREWTQEEMAEAVGISPQSVSKWELYKKAIPLIRTTTPIAIKTVICGQEI